MLAMARLRPGDWKPPIVVHHGGRPATGSTISSAAWSEHGAWLAESGERDRRRLARAREEISAIAVAELRQRLGALPGESQLEDLAARVAAGKLDPYTAADELISG